MSNDKAKHTPGPWRVTPGPADGYGEIIRGATVGYAIAECNRENHHDARLIAAAPELAACLLDVLDADGDLSAMDFDRYRAALEKAEV